MGVGTSVLVLILSLADFPVIIWICCYFKQKHKQPVNNSLNKSPSQKHSIAPIYEDILPKTVNCQETDIGFKINVAYDSVEIRP